MRSFVVLAFFVVLLAAASAQTTTTTSVASGVREDRLQTLKYGIDSEVIDLVTALRQEGNGDYRDQLVLAYRSTRNNDLRELLLGFFLDLKDKGLEAEAIAELKAPEKKPNGLLLTTVSYLTGIASEASEPTFVGLMTNANKTLALASIRALAKLGAKDRAGDILKIYRDPDTDPNFKADIIWSLGEMKASSAVDDLLREYDDNEKDPLLQGAVLTALGKIGDPRAWDKVKVAVDIDNAELRAAAVQTLPSFPGRFELAGLLTNALRDSQVGVRLAGAEASRQLKVPEVLDLLLFRVRKDPDARVRAACLRAVAAYDNASTQVLALLADRRTDFTVWKEALAQALDKKWIATTEVLRKVLEDENKDKNGVLAPVIASALLPKGAVYRELFGLLLANDKLVARSLALRAISAGNFREYEAKVRELSTKDTEASIRSQAAAVLKDWAPKS